MAKENETIEPVIENRVNTLLSSFFFMVKQSGGSERNGKVSFSRSCYFVVRVEVKLKTTYVAKAYPLCKLSI